MHRFSHLGFCPGVYTQKGCVVSIDVIDVVNGSQLFIFRCILVKKFMCGYFSTKQFKYIVLSLVWAFKENLQKLGVENKINQFEKCENLGLYSICNLNKQFFSPLELIQNHICQIFREIKN